jgi:cytochrome P450
VRCVLVNSPQLVEQVLVRDARNFKKHYAVRFARHLLGEGVLTSEGEVWRRQRRLCAPAFHTDRIGDYAADTVAEAQSFCAEMRHGAVRDMHADMMRLTLRIAAKALFGARIDDAAPVDGALESALADFADCSTSSVPLPKWIPTPRNLKLHAAVRRLNAVVRKIIENRRADRRRHDLLALLLAARDGQDGTGMSERQLLDEVRTFLLTAHETTAIAMAWTWYLVAGHPQVQARLHEELASVLGERAAGAADLPRLRYAERVLLESMRLYSPSFVIGRQALADCELGGYRIAAGTTVFMSQWVMHRDPRYYERPECFDPDRWADNTRQSLPKFAYFPFGGGPRSCIGSSFAMAELTLLLATIAKEWSLHLAHPDRAVRPSPLFTLRPGSAIEVVLHKRVHTSPGVMAPGGTNAAPTK